MENAYRIQLLSIVAGVLLLVYLIRLIIQGRLRIEYAFVWFSFTLMSLVFFIWREELNVVAGWVGILYPPTFVFIIAIFAMLIHLLHLSVVISKLCAQNRILAQEIALIKNKPGGYSGRER